MAVLVVVAGKLTVLAELASAGKDLQAEQEVITLPDLTAAVAVGRVLWVQIQTEHKREQVGQAVHSWL